MFLRCMCALHKHVQQKKATRAAKESNTCSKIFPHYIMMGFCCKSPNSWEGGNFSLYSTYIILWEGKVYFNKSYLYCCALVDFLTFELTWIPNRFFIYLLMEKLYVLSLRQKVNCEKVANL